MAIRLNKVKKDLQIGLNEISLFFRAKGITIQNNPNAKISDAEYSLIANELKKVRNVIF